MSSCEFFFGGDVDVEAHVCLEEDGFEEGLPVCVRVYIMEEKEDKYLFILYG